MQALRPKRRRAPFRGATAACRRPVSAGRGARHTTAPQSKAPDQGVNVLRKSIIIAASLAFAAAGLGSASADERQITVHFGDLDLAGDHDAAVLMGRLQRAALEACGGSTFSVPDYRRAVEHSACFRNTVNKAVDTVGAPTLVRLRNETGQFDAP
jgi:UrcA family protein